MKTIAKPYRILLSLVLATGIALVGRQFFTAALSKTSCNITIWLSPSVHTQALQAKIHTVLVLGYYISCGLVYSILLWIAHRVNSFIWSRRLARAGLSNSIGETPKPPNVYKHKDKKMREKGWRTYALRYFGLSDDDIRGRAGRLIGVFRGRIGDIRYSHNNKHILIDVQPYKYINPYVITYFADEIHRQGLLDMIRWSSMLVGASGSGKSTAMIYLMANYAAEGYTIIFIDPKNHDFPQLEQCANYFGGYHATDGWNAGFAHFENRRNKSKSAGGAYQKLLIVFDELPFYEDSLNRADREKFMRELGQFIRMIRSFDTIKLICGLQRSDAAYFPQGARENFGSYILMGSPSETSRKMIFEGDEEDMLKLVPARNIGDGNYYQRDVHSVEQIHVAKSADESDIYERVIEALNKTLFAE